MTGRPRLTAVRPHSAGRAPRAAPAARDTRRGVSAACRLWPRADVGRHSAHRADDQRVRGPAHGGGAAESRIVSAPPRAAGLAYREAGDLTERVVVLVHGYPESSYMWR